MNLRPRVELRFDRIMAISSGARANFKIVSGTSGNVTFIQPRVDPVERSIVFGLGAGVPDLQPNTEYRLLLEDSGRFADRLGAFDGTAFVGRAVVRFTTGDDATAEDDVDPEPVEACRATRILRDACAGSACHGGASPAMGLSLASDEGLATTALDRTSVLVASADEPSGTGEATRRFPFGLPIIARGASARSFLLFKILLDGRRTDPRTAQELGLHIPGSPMPHTARPPEPGGVVAGPLTLAEVKVLRRWIDGGAPACRAVSDAGTD